MSVSFAYFGCYRSKRDVFWLVCAFQVDSSLTEACARGATIFLFIAFVRMGVRVLKRVEVVKL